MNCYKCKKGIDEGIALFRQNPKGETGVWACAECNTQPIDPEVQEIVNAVQEKLL